MRILSLGYFSKTPFLLQLLEVWGENASVRFVIWIRTWSEQDSGFGQNFTLFFRRVTRAR